MVWKDDSKEETETGKGGQIFLVQSVKHSSSEMGCWCSTGRGPEQRTEAGLWGVLLPVLLSLRKRIYHRKEEEVESSEEEGAALPVHVAHLYRLQTLPLLPLDTT